MARIFDAPERNSLEAVAIRGVLFDIDDTLIDLRTAAIQGFLEKAATDLSHIQPDRKFELAEDFADNGAKAYERYMAGELSFLGQREVRLQRAYAFANVAPPVGEDYLCWAQNYEKRVQSAWKPFPDVQTFLDLHKELGIPFGVVSSNVEEYQRNQLNLSGPRGFTCVVGSDTAGAPKPATEAFLAGFRALGISAAETLYVGDNPVNDYEGATRAGLQAALIDRAAVHKDFPGRVVSGLDQLSEVFARNSADFR